MKLLKESHKRQNIGQIITAIFVFVVLLVCSFFLYSYLNPKQVNKTKVYNKAILSPTFSHGSGFYEDDFMLEIKSSNPNFKIYYSVDGSRPTVFSNLYNKPIHIESKVGEPNKLSHIKNSPVFLAPLERVFKGTVVRAVAILDDSLFGDEVVGSFFITPQGREKYSLPVFSLVSDAKNFFGYKEGIYVNGATTDDKDYYLKNNINIEDSKKGFPTNYKRRGLKWERPVNLAFFDVGTNKGFQVNAGVRIHGNATRERPQKSLKFYFKDIYGIDALTYPLFGTSNTENFYQTFLLRNSGQDMYKARMRDAVMQQILTGMTSVDLQKYRPSILFINGEYWGIHDIRERIDEFYFHNKYQIPLDSLVILGSGSSVEYGDSTASVPYVSLLKFALSHDLSSRQNYDRVSSSIDIDNFIDYVIAELYSGNPDWPHNNVNLWRYNTKVGFKNASFKDGRWRWALYDLDLGFGAERNVAHKTITSFLKNKGNLGALLNSLLANKVFRDKFFSRYDFHLTNTFSSNRVISIINKVSKELEPEMEEHLVRWRTLNSAKAWQKEVSLLKDFASKRPKVQHQELEVLKRSFTRH